MKQLFLYRFQQETLVMSFLLLFLILVFLVHWHQLQLNEPKIRKTWFLTAQHGRLVNSGLTNFYPLHAREGASDLLIFSTMRSGSTFTGEVVRDTPGTFFAFEPIARLALYHYFTDDTICKMRNLICSDTSMPGQLREAYTIIGSLYSCKFGDHVRGTIDWIASQNKSGNPWQQYAKCKMNKTRCITELENACRKADIRVTKVLRFRMDLLQPLLSTFPNLKILFLVRDPRAMLFSRLMTPWFPVYENDTQTVLDNVMSFCNKMEFDMDAFELFQEQFPGRLLLLRIEDMAANSRTAFLDLYKFINVTSPRYAYERMQKLTQENPPFTTKWKKGLAWQFVAMVQTHCNRALRVLKYPVYSNEGSLRKEFM